MIYALGDEQPELVGNGHFLADSAAIIGKIRLLDSSSVWFGCVLRGDNEWIEVGEMSNVQDGCVLHSDFGFPLRIGRNVTVGHKAMLHGCTIGNNSLIGMGATVLNGARIGDNCLIGMGAIVMDRVAVEPGVMIGAGSLVPPGKVLQSGFLYTGSPARQSRPLTDQEKDYFAYSANYYVKLAERHRKALAAMG